MRYILSGKVIVYLCILIILEICVLPSLFMGLVRPSLLSLLIVYSVFEWRWEMTLSLAVTIGLLQDLLGSQIMGLETMVIVMLTIVLDFFVPKIQNKLSQKTQPRKIANFPFLLNLLKKLCRTMKTYYG